MKNFLKIIIPLIIIGAVAYQFRVKLQKEALPIWNEAREVTEQIKDNIFPSAPCAEPIPYVLGTFDTKFNISKDYFLSALTEAEAIWEKPSQKDLFVYAPEDSSSKVLKINLIYDFRQEATSKLAGLGIVVKDNRASYDMLKAKLTALSAEYESNADNFTALVEAFNQKQEAYGEEVDSWNKKGGAPQGEYDRLEATRLQLNAESKKLETMQINLNNMVDEINAVAVVLNRLITTLNLSVEKYNTTNTARGESFEEGVYTSDGRTKEIDIYEFSSRAKLVRVLAHELGHALGLEHVEDAKAIMYKLNQGSSEELTKADLAALEAKCGVE